MGAGSSPVVGEGFEVRPVKGLQAVLLHSKGVPSKVGWGVMVCVACWRQQCICWETCGSFSACRDAAGYEPAINECVLEY